MLHEVEQRSYGGCPNEQGKHSLFPGQIAIDGHVRLLPDDDEPVIGADDLSVRRGAKYAWFNLSDHRYRMTLLLIGAGAFAGDKP